MRPIDACVSVCLLACVFVCLLCGIRACMNEWVSDVRKWSMSIAHSNDSSSVWFAWPSIKQYLHRHLLSHVVETHSLTRTHINVHTNSSSNTNTINTTLDLCYHLARSSTIFHFVCVCVRVCLKFDFATLVTPSLPYHDGDTTGHSCSKQWAMFGAVVQLSFFKFMLKCHT